MTGGPFEVTVVIPTLAEARRADLISRAIASVLSQEGVAAVPLVVANGGRFDPAVLEALRTRPDVRFCYRQEAGLAGAYQQGREMVETPFFAFLDDDDEYLPHALGARLAVMRANEAADVVVSNGFRVRNGRRSASACNIGEARRNPLAALLVNNWLTSCGGLYRTSRIGPELFRELPAFAEWTYLAFKLSLTRRFEFVDDPAYLVHYTAGSLSASADYRLSQVAALERILELELPVEIRPAVQMKYGAALHDLASYWLADRRLGAAWEYHLKSLVQRGGLRYLGYTRKLLGGLVRIGRSA